ncbi:hypothetical protein F5Y08DRAFT_339327 [Xylaria arbuscula]|nr:hypothetical protein F5Y08DRAFT_339327 [Xylaria arbuscula]
MENSARTQFLKCLNDVESFYGCRRQPDEDKRDAIAKIRTQIFGSLPGINPPPLRVFGDEVDGIVRAYSEYTGEFIRLVFDQDKKVWWTERDRPGRLPAFCTFFRFECPRLYNNLVVARREEILLQHGSSALLEVKTNKAEVVIEQFVKSDCVYLDHFIDVMVNVFPDTAKQSASYKPGPLPLTIAQSFSQIRRPMFEFEDLYNGLLHIDSRDSEIRGTPRTSIGPSDYPGMQDWPTMVLGLFDELASSASLHEEFLVLVGHWKLGGVPEDLVEINVNAMHFEHSYDRTRWRLRNRLVYVKAELDCIRNHMQGMMYSWLDPVKDYDSHERDPCEAIKWLSVHVPPYGTPRTSAHQPDTKKLHPWTAQHWLETHEGEKWLQEKCDISFCWLRTWWGRHWLAETAAGEAFLQTLTGAFWRVLYERDGIPEPPRTKEYSFSVLPLRLLRKPPFGLQRNDYLANHFVAPRKVRFVEFPGHGLDMP